MVGRRRGVKEQGPGRGWQLGAGSEAREAWWGGSLGPWLWLAPWVWLVLVPPSLPLASSHTAGMMGGLPESCWSAPCPPTLGSEPVPPKSGMLAWRGGVGPQDLPALAPGERGCSIGFWKRVLGGPPSHRRSGDGHPHVFSVLFSLGSSCQATASTEMETCVQGACWVAGGTPRAGLLFPGPRARRVVVTRFACYLSLGALPHWSLIGASTGPRAE